MVVTVDCLFFVEPKSSLIGKRKAPAKKLGAKKGLGGQKITKSFSEIEQQIEQEEKMKHGKCIYQMCVCELLVPYQPPQE